MKADCRQIQNSSGKKQSLILVLETSAKKEIAKENISEGQENLKWDDLVLVSAFPPASFAQQAGNRGPLQLITSTVSKEVGWADF